MRPAILKLDLDISDSRKAYAFMMNGWVRIPFHRNEEVEENRIVCLNEATPSARFGYENQQILECDLRKFRGDGISLFDAPFQDMHCNVCDKSYNVKHHEIHINGKRHKRMELTT
ncbi:hypothetical protein CDAR_541301 [Caerostris darwini]|uniref:C2H2-type domain-containing protein n=1 Tax=Caerostris darwini TaxID=1538125 RepID=A0AAV4RTX4_9ARAC|nr:hypothetical protein CDAR_541301 [Caerostris darwini]